MVGDLNHTEMMDLLGVYALNAVDTDEREAIDSHLDECAQCRREVAEHREVAGMLASGWLPAPDGVWDRIASSLEETPPPLRMPASKVVRLDEERRRRRPLGGLGRALAAVGVAASVAVVGLIGFNAITSNDAVDDVSGVASAAAARPDARRVVMRSADGTLTAKAVILGDGTGYVLDANLPQLPPDRTYQLWAVVGTSRISVGVLGRNMGPLAFHAAGDVSAFAITNETAGGVIVSQQQPTVVGTLA